MIVVNLMLDIVRSRVGHEHMAMVSRRFYGWPLYCNRYHDAVCHINSYHSLDC